MRIVNGRSRTTIGTSCAPTLAGALALLAGTSLTLAQPDQLASVPTGAQRASAQIPGAATSQPAQDEEMVSFDQFSEAVELTTLVDFVGQVLEINIVIKGTLTGSITFNAEVAVPLSELLPMLRALLEQWDYTITETEVPGLYTVLPVGDIAPVIGGTTRVVPTPNVKPSLLVDTLTELLGGSQNQVRAIDELGVIVATAPPLQLDRIERMVDEFLALYRAQEYTRIELDYIAAPTARERAIGLVGGSLDGFSAQQGGINRQPGQPNTQTGALGLGGSGLDNLGDRLAVDAQGNALIFRGTQEELATVIQIIDVIDVPNTLSPRNYFAGSAALQIADIASQQGLGEVITLQTNQESNFQALQQRNINPQSLGRTSARTGGPVMVVDPNRQSIIYYGTPSQQEQLAALMEELKTEDDRIVIRHYKLSYADSEAVADLITGLISGQSQTGSSPLLPGGAGGAPQPAQNFVPGPGGDDEIGVFDPNRVFVIADVDNNQVVVKAPLKQQDEFAKLIERLDLRRPQVFIEATIVSVSDNSDFRLRIESQITSGQFGIQNLNGLSSPGSNGFLSRRDVASNLAGLTTAVIKSQYVPVIVNAIKTDTDSKILSRPSLLVNDNEEARIVSLEQQPTTTTSQGDATTQTSFQGFEDAGTTLEVTPSISEAGSLSLQYRIELSNFVGSGSNGIPAPRQERTVEGQVTIPSDATIVVGGIKVDNISDTVVKVPLLGDIPLVGHAFRDTQKTNNSSTLYVFITPRIMTDPNFYDLKLFSQGPQSEMELEDDIPSMEPVRIELQPGSAPKPPSEPPARRTRFLEIDTSAPAPVIGLDGTIGVADDGDELGVEEIRD